MANTYVDYVGNGSETDFNFSFPYIKTSHVAVEVNEGPAGGTNRWVRTTDFTVQTSPTTFVRFNSAPANLVKVRVLRDSDASIGIVDFANGSVLTETELDNAYEHNRYLAEEAEEGITGGALVKNPDTGQFNADALRLENLADPDSDDDAVNKGYADNRYVDVAGDTMTGALSMDGNNITGVNSVQGLVAPTSDNHAASKEYVDDTDADRKTYIDNAINTEASARVAGDALKVNKSGDTMTGALTLPGVDPSDLNHATSKRYVDAQIAATLATGVAGGPIDTVNISDGAVTTAKIEDDAVTAAKLDNTTVTPGSYTNTDITVDENGRITAASNGSGGAGATNIGQTLTNTSVEITSSTGTNTTITGAVASGNAGVMTGADKALLDTAVQPSDNISTLTNDSGFTANAGTVTQVSTSTGLTGGPITGTGTISIDAGGVDTTQLANNAVTFAKMQQISNRRVIGNMSGAIADPEPITIIDDDTMGTAANNSLATSESIKAYVDSQISGVQAKCSFESNGFINSGGKVNVSTVVRNGTGQYTVTFTNAVTNPIVQATIADNTDIHSSGTVRESKLVVSNVSSTGCVIKTGRGSYSSVDCPVHLIVF